VIAFGLLASIALAGPNAGGVLVLHATTLEYTTDVATYEGLSEVACGQDGPEYPGVQHCPPYDPVGGADPCLPEAANPTSTMPPEVPHVWYIMAAFPPESCPRLKGLAFRIGYDPTKVTVIANGVADSQVSYALPFPSDVDYSAFPSNRSGMMMAYHEARTSLLQEIWWFAGYSYDGATNATFAVEEMEGEGNDRFVDDSFPRDTDGIAGFGILGLGEATGSNPTWESALGACCGPNSACSLTLQAACPAPGFWQGIGTICSPNPCPANPPPGSIVAWGRNDYDQCFVPLPNTGFVAVAVGGSHNLGLTSDGAIVAWGSYGWGECSVPPPNADFVAVAAGLRLSLGLEADGTIVAWGINSDGQCDVPSPNSGFVAVAAGGLHGLGLKADGTIVAWGRSSDGQCDVPLPNTEFVAVEGGGSFSLGLKADGTIVAWGDNYWGQCNVPSPNADFVAIGAGGRHSLGLKSDGTIVAWGYNGWGQCSIPSPNADFVTIGAGGEFSLGLKSDGTIVAWGSNSDGQCDVPALNVEFVAVAGGGAHSLGLTSIGITTGACCAPDGTCALTIQAACQSGSVWQGAGTTCTPDPCVPTPVLLESWAARSLAEGLQIRWEIPLGTTGARYRAWRDPAAGPHDLAPTPDAVLVSVDWASASLEGIVETLDPAAPRGTAVRYFLETSAEGGGFIGPVEARWDPPALGWSIGPTPFHGTVRLSPPGTGSARVEIFDPTGRLVRTLVRADGSAPLEWGGRDDYGREAPAGVYLARLRSGAGSEYARLVKAH
jgi:hypothetical protein